MPETEGAHYFIHSQLLLDIDNALTLTPSPIQTLCGVGMKQTESEDNADAAKVVSRNSDVDEQVPVEPQDHAKGLHQTVNENFVKEGENPGEKALDLSSKNGGEIVENFVKEGENPDEKALNLSSKDGGEIVEVTHESLVSDAEWVCKSPDGGFSSSASEWPSFNTKSYSYPYSAKVDKASVAVLHLQHKAIEACEKFLAGNAGSDCDEDEDKGEDDDEDELVDNYDYEECEEYKFFERIFKEDGELRRYYVNNHKDGDFYCLVCGGIGKKVWKTFKDCTALLHHSTAILKTPRKRAHRAYAQVICKVVGRDIDQLPAIVIKDLDSSLAASTNLLFEPEKLSASSNDGRNGEADDPVDRDIDYKCFFLKEIAKADRIKYGNFDL